MNQLTISVTLPVNGITAEALRTEILKYFDETQIAIDAIDGGQNGYILEKLLQENRFNMHVGEGQVNIKLEPLK